MKFHKYVLNANIIASNAEDRTKIHGFAASIIREHIETNLPLRDKFFIMNFLDGADGVGFWINFTTDIDPTYFASLVAIECEKHNAIFRMTITQTRPIKVFGTA